MLRRTALIVVLLGLLIAQTPVAHALPSGPLKIVALGDSLTEGQGDDDGRGGYPQRLQALIEPLRAGTVVVNLGKSGWDTSALINGDQGLPSQLKLAQEAKPDIALLWIGSNDLWYSTYGSDDQAPIDQYRANMVTILDSLQETKAVLVIALLDDQSKRPYALKSDSGYSADDLKRMSRYATEFNKIIEELATQYGALTVDFFKTTIFTDAATLYDDGNHPNAAGYDKIADIWFKPLEGLISGQITAPTPAATAASK